MYGRLWATPGAATSATSMSLILPLQNPSNAATDVNTGQCRNLCYAVNAVYAQQELYGGQFKDATGRPGKSGRWRRKVEKLNGKSWDAWWDNLGA